MPNQNSFIIGDIDSYHGNATISMSHGVFSFVPLNVMGDVPLKTAYMAVLGNASGSNISAYVGIYSLVNSSLTLLNYISGSGSITNTQYLSLTSTSVQSTITYGKLWAGVGIYFSNTTITMGVKAYACAASVIRNNAPPTFWKGYMTATTAAPPTNIATSDIGVSSNLLGDGEISILLDA